MAFKEIDSRGLSAYYQCLAADTKPTANIPNGAVLVTVDNGKKYLFHEGTWYEQ